MTLHALDLKTLSHSHSHFHFHFQFHPIPSTFHPIPSTFCQLHSSQLVICFLPAKLIQSSSKFKAISQPSSDFNLALLPCRSSVTHPLGASPGGCQSACSRVRHPQPSLPSFASVLGCLHSVLDHPHLERAVCYPFDPRWFHPYAHRSLDSPIFEFYDNLALAESLALFSGRGLDFSCFTPEQEEAALIILRDRLISEDKLVQKDLLERYVRFCRQASQSYPPLPITGLKACIYIIRALKKPIESIIQERLATVIESWRVILTQEVDPKLAGSESIWTSKPLRQLCNLQEVSGSNQVFQTENGVSGPSSMANQPNVIDLLSPALDFSSNQLNTLASNSLNTSVPQTGQLGTFSNPFTLDCDQTDQSAPVSNDRCIPVSSHQSEHAINPQLLNQIDTSFQTNLQSQKLNQQQHSLELITPNPLSHQSSHPIPTFSRPNYHQALNPTPSDRLAISSSYQRHPHADPISSARLSYQPSAFSSVQQFDQPPNQSFDTTFGHQLGHPPSAFIPPSSVTQHPSRFLIPHIVNTNHLPSTALAEWQHALRQLDLALTELFQMCPLFPPPPLEAASLYRPKPYSPSYQWTPQSLPCYIFPSWPKSGRGLVQNLKGILDWPPSIPILAFKPRQEEPISQTPSSTFIPGPSKSGIETSDSSPVEKRPSQIIQTSSFIKDQLSSNQQSVDPTSSISSTPLPPSNLNSNNSVSCPSTSIHGGQNNLRGMVSSRSHTNLSSSEPPQSLRVTEVQKTKFINTYNQLDPASQAKIEATLKKNNLWELIKLIPSSSQTSLKPSDPQATISTTHLDTPANSIPSNSTLPQKPSKTNSNFSPNPSQITSQTLPPSHSAGNQSVPPLVPQIAITPDTNLANCDATFDQRLDPIMIKMVTAMLSTGPQPSAVLTTAFASLGINNKEMILSHLKALAVCIQSPNGILWKLSNSADPPVATPLPPSASLKNCQTNPQTLQHIPNYPINESIRSNGKTVVTAIRQANSSPLNGSQDSPTEKLNSKPLQVPIQNLNNEIQSHLATVKNNDPTVILITEDSPISSGNIQKVVAPKLVEMSPNKANDDDPPSLTIKRVSKRLHSDQTSALGQSKHFKKTSLKPVKISIEQIVIDDPEPQKSSSSSIHDDESNDSSSFTNSLSPQHPTKRLSSAPKLAFRSNSALKKAPVKFEPNTFQDHLPGFPDVNPAVQNKGSAAKILARYPADQQMSPIRTFVPIWRAKRS
ncbi:hypothetical protein O181_008908 [Austropuccinia psidii MF-1]|uniref:Uncharacterized protein n=1 Tax=Austropuccinia psidii MF-1 TaxID=1389203 RepID=A0A9Q3GIY3_9BASI|nr:hypothetical protein [Austropuccinia psidii MF-1]